jgi:uncharacterized membrane protein
MTKNLLAVVLGLVLIAVIVCGPFFVIWAWNTLFGAMHLIDYTFWTWLAVLIIGVFLSPNVKIARKS